MTKEEVERKLNQYKTLELRILKRLEEAQEARDMCGDGIRALVGEERRLVGGAPHLIERALELEAEAEEMKREKKNIEALVNSLQNPSEQQVLIMRYFQGCEWWQIARKLAKGERWVKRLKAAALISLVAKQAPKSPEKPRKATLQNQKQ